MKILNKGKIKQSIETGISFGLTSGIITPLGLMIGLEAGTESKIVVIGGLITVAIADAFSDTLGIHVSQESRETLSRRKVWESTIAAFVSKFLIVSSFIIPLILFELSTAIYISIIWGFIVLSALSYHIANANKENKIKAIIENLSIATIVLLISYFVGTWISNNFN